MTEDHGALSSLSMEDRLRALRQSQGKALFYKDIEAHQSLLLRWSEWTGICSRLFNTVFQRYDFQATQMDDAVYQTTMRELARDAVEQGLLLEEGSTDFIRLLAKDAIKVVTREIKPPLREGERFQSFRQPTPIQKQWLRQPDVLPLGDDTTRKPWMDVADRFEPLFAEKTDVPLELGSGYDFGLGKLIDAFKEKAPTADAQYSYFRQVAQDRLHADYVDIPTSRNRNNTQEGLAMARKIMGGSAYISDRIYFRVLMEHLFELGVDSVAEIDDDIRDDIKLRFLPANADWKTEFKAAARQVIDTHLDGVIARMSAISKAVMKSSRLEETCEREFAGVKQSMLEAFAQEYHAREIFLPPDPSKGARR